jgi:predicted phosphodiesterase
LFGQKYILFTYAFGSSYLQTPMKKLLQKILRPPVMWLANKYTSRPNKQRVHTALTELYNHIIAKPDKKGPVIPFEKTTDSFIIFSDQHKGARNGYDDFAVAEKNYLAALHFYNEKNFHYITLGDSEELWENTLSSVRKHNAATFEMEKLFQQRKAFTKIFGNHDLYWDNDPLSKYELEKVYGEKICIYEGAILHTAIEDKSLQIFLTHGHQGDAISDGNALSKWFIANMWAPLQSFLNLNPNTPAFDDNLKSDHNRMMYEWSAQQQNLLLITGHTHQPIFQSLTHLEKLYRQLAQAKEIKNEEEENRLEAEIKLRRRQGQSLPDFTAYKPSYFNTGCCCFNDGDMTGIEIAEGMIRLIKWEYKDNVPTRIILEENALKSFIE